MGTEIKIPTQTINQSFKLLTRVPVLLAQIKAGKNSHKLKTKNREILSLYQHNKITKKLYNNLMMLL